MPKERIQKVKPQAKREEVQQEDVKTDSKEDLLDEIDEELDTIDEVLAENDELFWADIDEALGENIEYAEAFCEAFRQKGGE